MKKVKRNWIPLYIIGRECFGQPVQEALEKSNLPWMPGYLYDNSLANEHCMFWVDENTSLREYKKAIGAKLIWKYRLQFFSDLEKLSSSSKQEDEEFNTAA